MGAGAVQMPRIWQADAIPQDVLSARYAQTDVPAGVGSA